MRSVRLKTGRSQGDVSDRLGFPQSFLSKVERGDRQLQLVEFVLICRELGVSPTETLGTYLDSLPVLSLLGSTARVKRNRPKA